MPECQLETMVFAGETTLAAIGLETEAGPDAHHLGRIWYSATPIDAVVSGPNGPEPLPNGYLVCAEWDDQGGSSMAMSVDASWNPPVAAETREETQPTLVIIAGAFLAITVVIAVSYVVFRQPRAAGGA